MGPFTTGKKDEWVIDYDDEAVRRRGGGCVVCACVCVLAGFVTPSSHTTARL
jgi:hypothetical protein